ncbi:hypothetical protein ACP70R_046348 [Stipagrostis hirtigluma subsp. patula]
MAMMVKRWVQHNLGSPSWLLLAPLVAACAPRSLPQMYFNLHLRRHVRHLLPFLDPFVTVDIPKSKRDHSMDEIKSSDAYEEVKAYLSAACSRDARELRADGAAEGDGFVLSLREGQEVADEFRGATVWWSSVPPQGQGKCLRLTFHEKHRGLVITEYLPHVRRSGRDVMFGNRRRRLYTNKRDLSYVASRDEVWSYIDFDHPTTFDTLAMHPAKKRKIMEDLDDFRSNKEYYRRIGKAWKRGYLLHGPPGTGKSTMIAAMANYLNYDIYDIELTMVRSNNDLRKLFIETTGKSIIVIEDIDCSLDLTGQRGAAASNVAVPANADAATIAMAAALNEKKRSSSVTLSGLLNFIDGLWSAHSGERIIVFTTNFIDKLDPALIRTGRMDMHVEMSYCGFEAFTTLAKNYLDVDEHPLFDTVRELLQVVEITPADVAECLMTSKRSDRGAGACLGRLIDELKKRAMEKKGKEEKAEEEAAAAAVEKPNDKREIVNGRRVIDPRAIRRLKKETKDMERDDDKAAVKPNDREPIANEEAVTCRSNLCADGSFSDRDDKTDAYETNGMLAMHVDGGTEVSVGDSGRSGDLNDSLSDDDYDDGDSDW